MAWELFIGVWFLMENCCICTMPQPQHNFTAYRADITLVRGKHFALYLADHTPAGCAPQINLQLQWNL